MKLTIPGAGKRHWNQEEDKIKMFDKESKAFSPIKTLMLFLVIVPATGMVAAQTVVTFFSFFPQLSLGFFVNGIVKVYETYRVNISPSKLFFLLPPLNQAGQIGVILYTVRSFCSSTAYGPKLTNPAILTPLFFIIWTVGTALNIVWNFVFDRVFLAESVAFLAFSIVLLIPAYGLVSYRLKHFLPQLRSDKRAFDIVFLRFGVLNSLAMQITYYIISLFLNATILASLSFSRPDTTELISTTSLGVLTALTVVFTALDVTLLEPFTRFVLSPYLTIAVSLVSMMQASLNASSPSSILKVFALVTCLFGAVVKLAVSAFKRDMERIPGDEHERETVVKSGDII